LFFHQSRNYQLVIAFRKCSVSNLFLYGVIGSAVVVEYIRFPDLKNSMDIYGEKIEFHDKTNKGQIYGGLIFWIRLGSNQSLSWSCLHKLEREPP
jgi:hypothetical protein